MTNNEKEELAVRIDDAVLAALSQVGVRYSGTIKELVQRFSHSIADHAETVESEAWNEVIRRTCQLN